MILKQALRSQRGQSLIELIFLLPIYVLLLIFVVQFTSMYFGVFHDFSEIRNKALKDSRKAEATRAACYEEKNRHGFGSSFFGGSSSTAETKIRLYAYGNGPANCPG